VTNFDDICTGLAANLAPLSAQGFQISPYLLDAPVPDTIQVAGLVAAQFDVAFRGSDDVVVDEYDIAIEVALDRQPPERWQKTLRALLAQTGDTSLRAALESDTKLTSRMADDLSVTSGHDPACDDLHVTDYRGQTTYTLEDGVTVSLAVWTVHVLT
jgi:hypothetical protein